MLLDSCACVTFLPLIIFRNKYVQGGICQGGHTGVAYLKFQLLQSNAYFPKMSLLMSDIKWVVSIDE